MPGRPVRFVRVGPLNRTRKGNQDNPAGPVVYERNGPMARRSRLEKLLIDRVDLVDDGANPDASILLFKRDQGDDMADDKAKDDDVQKAGKAISAARMARLKSLRDELASLIADAQGDKMADEDKDKDDVGKAKDAAEDPVVKAKFEAFQKQIDDLKAQADDAIAKAAAAKAEADAAVAKAAQEVEKRERADFAKRATDDLSHLPGSADDKGNLLYTLSKKLDDAEFKAIDTMLKAANEAAKTGKVTEEVGKSGKAPAGDSAFAKMKTLAAELVAKGTAKTEADAIAVVAQTNPELYAEHLADMKAQAKS